MSEAMHDIAVQEIPNMLKKLIDSSQSQASSKNAIPSGYNLATCASHAPGVGYAPDAAWTTYVEYPVHRPTNAVHASDAVNASPTGDASDAADASPAGDASPVGDASDAIDVAPIAMVAGVQFHSGGLR
ncbi:hypothetical protein Taro_002116, partial [Colocasia esculenta]|nr:hypothetical protein [Colocasia esculenta]